MPVTNYVWDVENDSYLMETDAAGDPTVTFTQEPTAYGALVSQRSATVTETFHTDGTGSIRSVTDSSGAVTHRYSYRAFGESITATGGSDNAFRYIGRQGYYFDSDIGTYYVRARTYSPATGRWLSADPARFVDGSNRYGYGRNDPVRFSDPSGLACIEACRLLTPLKPGPVTTTISAEAGGSEFAWGTNPVPIDSKPTHTILCVRKRLIYFPYYCCCGGVSTQTRLPFEQRQEVSILIDPDYVMIEGGKIGIGPHRIGPDVGIAWYDMGPGARKRVTNRYCKLLAFPDGGPGGKKFPPWRPCKVQRHVPCPDSIPPKTRTCR